MPNSTAPSGVTDMAQGDQDTLNWIVGWIFAGALVYGLTRTKSGYTFVYYALLLLVIFLVLTQYVWVAKELGYAVVDTGGMFSSSSSTSKTTGVSQKSPKELAYGPAGLINFTN